MKQILAFFAFIPALALAAPFDGTWTIDPASMKITGKPDVYLLTGGVFTCGPCLPAYSIKADGKYHKVANHAYYDNASVSVIDANTVEFKARAGEKAFSERKFTVSADGQTLTYEWITHDAATPHNGKDSYKRVAPAPAGAASMSGSWSEIAGASSQPTDYLVFTYLESADGLKMTSPTNQSFEAKFDGTPVLTQGDPGHTMVALKRLDSHTIKEIDRRKGTVTDIIISKISADGSTMQVTDRDPTHGTITSYKATKQ